MYKTNKFASGQSAELDKTIVQYLLTATIWTKRILRVIKMAKSIESSLNSGEFRVIWYSQCKPKID